jgi:tetratricopeptide (TPR) repeat protein
MTRTGSVFLAALIVGLIIALGAPAGASPPLPQDLKIEPAAPDLPPGITDFLGVWEGLWKGLISHHPQRSFTPIPLMLVVEQVDAEGARVVFSLGKDPNHRFREGWRRLRVKFARRDKWLELPVVFTDQTANNTISFFVNDRGQLEGRYIEAGTFYDIELQRRPELTEKFGVKGGGAPASPQAPGKRGESTAGSLGKKSLHGRIWKKPKELASGSLAGYRGRDERDFGLGRRNIDDSLYNDGVDFLRQGEYAGAVTKFQEALKLNPRNGSSIFNCGLAYARQGLYDQGLAEFTKYLALDAKDLDAYYNRGLTYALKGQPEAALADFNKALQLNSRDAQALYMRGFVYSKLGQAEKARADYQAALQQDAGWVRQVTSGGQDEMATYALAPEGQAKGPAGPKAAAKEGGAAHKKQGKALARKGQYDEALAELHRALELDPKDGEAYALRGSIHILKGNFDQAVADFNKALEINPRQARAHYNRGLAFYHLKKYDQVVADLTKAIELSPKDAEAFQNRGLAYKELGRPEQAIDDFNMAIILKPELADAYFNKAVTCDQAGRREEAQEAYEAFLKKAPPEARERIEAARSRLRK